MESMSLLYREKVTSTTTFVFCTYSYSSGLIPARTCQWGYKLYAGSYPLYND